MTIILRGLASLLSFLGLGERAPPGKPNTIPIKVTVINDLTGEQISYSTTVGEGWTVFGALKELQNTNSNFRFVYTTDNHIGLYLESVNGLPGIKGESYWELLTQKPGGHPIPLDVGIGCYQPQRDENLILKFITYAKKRDLFHDDL